ncbi:TBC1 domain family member 15 isoform X2 [Gossypium australe]|uniref:TBC1 domain family member 15 isoform X2 n=1 Tax=Gossypium australe TaxID=47621 RepID=A0A5B6W1D3_9ROSI|nr:TBC1 domain family member 15 isoform X2 [Gossypium australe]
MFGKKAGTEELEAFYPIRPECVAEIPKTRFKPRVCIIYSSLPLLKFLFHSVCNPCFLLDVYQFVGHALAILINCIRQGKLSVQEDGMRYSLKPVAWILQKFLDGSKEGRLWSSKLAHIILRKFELGIHPSIKGLVWEFLLGCYNPNSTLEDRNQLRQQRRERYSMWKTECQNMVSVIGSGNFITTPIITDDGQPIEVEGCRMTSAVSDKKVAQWMLILHQIGLDVVRTDRALAFYEDKANQAKLWDVLSIYSWVDDDIGYVQGMNDICSPMVILLENEADAFWCFERAMRRLVYFYLLQDG